MYQYMLNMFAEKVLQNKPWSFDKLFIVSQRYNKDTVLEEYSLNEVALWVQVHNIPMGYMDREIAEEICSKIGKVGSPRVLKTLGVMALLGLE